MTTCCDGCPDGDCDGVPDLAVDRVREWLAKRKYSPTGVSPEVASTLEEMLVDMEAGVA